ncbi:family 16 glycosylhydrolase [Algivirga pacifica]|uniref:GH16 domain-containing protein n=1 Tax=Algivirga pacifica TaxID=1162670 RepID=A0ABP9DL84_9BACT
MKYIYLLLLQLCAVSILPAQEPCYELVWSDEFEGSGLPNAEKWSYDVGGHGWGNDELQYYTDARTKNARLQNGKLVIEAHNEGFGGKQYTSARLVSKGKGDWLYGKVVVRAKLPTGVGTWPAIWMLPTDWEYGGWPSSGEIDIMEHVGYDPGVVHGTVHTEAYHHSIGTQKGQKIEVPDFSTAFHDYTLEWTEDQIRIYVDDQQYFTFDQHGTYKEWPFDKRFHLLLNIAVGGFWGGIEGVDPSAFPVRMEVDYVRVYQQTAPPLEIKGEGYLDAGSTAVFKSSVQANAYEWSFPEGVEILEGAGTSEVTVKWGEVSGTVSLSITGNCDTYHTITTVEVLGGAPTGDTLKLPLINDLGGILWEIPSSFEQLFDLSEKDEVLELQFAVEDPSLNPYIYYEIPGSVDLREHHKLEITLKAEKGKAPESIRLDLVDIDGNSIEKPLFTMNEQQIFDDGQWKTYRHWFNHSDQPAQGIDLSKVAGMKMYVNYGFFATAKSGKLMLGGVHWVKPEVGEQPEPLENKPKEENPILSIDKVPSVRLKAYPNPTQDFLYFETIELLKEDSIQIISMMGQRIRVPLKYANGHTVQLDLRSLQPGIYFLKAGRYSASIVKQ